MARGSLSHEDLEAKSARDEKQKVISRDSWKWVPVSGASVRNSHFHYVAAVFNTENSDRVFGVR